MTSLYLPIDEIIGNNNINYNVAADFLELAAFLSRESTVATSVIVNEASIGASEDYENLTDELIGGCEIPYEEELLCGVAEQLRKRKSILKCSYPFSLDSNGNILTYCSNTNFDGWLGPTAYTLSLLLSNLRGLSPILDGSGLHPNKDEERCLRRSFQYFATAALAAEINGRAWSFGFPRPDQSGFSDKLQEIWRMLGDGVVQPQIGTPLQPKDDGIDVFAARLPGDDLPGFLLVAGQVATGKGYREKSAKQHIGIFRSRWFGSQPATEFIGYMVVPFAMESEKFTDDVRILGNILHRLRLPKRVAQAVRYVRTSGDTSMFEGYGGLNETRQWMDEYRRRAIGENGETASMS